MKKFFRFAFAVVAMAGMVMLASCGKDDEEDDQSDDLADYSVTIDGVTKSETTTDWSYTFPSGVEKDSLVFCYYISSDGKIFNAGKKVYFTPDSEVKDLVVTSVYGCQITLEDQIVDTVEIGASYTLPEEFERLGKGPIMYWMSEDESTEYELGESVTITQNTRFLSCREMLRFTVDGFCDFVNNDAKGQRMDFQFAISDYSADNYIKIENLFNTLSEDEYGIRHVKEASDISDCTFSLVLESGTIDEIPEAAFAWAKLGFVDLSQTSVKKIGQMAFLNCFAYAFYLPATLEEIGYRAFASNLIENITIPKNVSKIDSEAFVNCDKLKTVTFTGTDVETIGDWAFYSQGFGTLDITIKVPAGSLSTYKERFPQYADMFQE